MYHNIHTTEGAYLKILTLTFSSYPVNITSPPIFSFSANFQVITNIYKHNTKKLQFNAFGKTLTPTLSVTLP